MLEVAGIDLLPPLAQFLAFALAGLALNIVPGADMTFVIASAAKGGRRDGVIAALGIGGGTLVHILGAVLGLSAILAASQTAFTLIKWVGAAYLFYIAVSLLRSGRGDQDRRDGIAPQSGWRLLRAAALVNVLNPKVALFFLAFLPQFVESDAANKPLAFLFLGLVFNVNGTLWNLFIAWSAARVSAGLRQRAAALKWFNRCVGGIFVALGIRLALAHPGEPLLFHGSRYHRLTALEPGR